MRRERGIALVLVLWVTLLLSVIVGSYTLVSRVETLTSRNLLDATRAFYAAEAGLHRAVAAMQVNDPQLQWVPDGRPYTMKLGEADVEMRVVDESGRIDLNAAQREQLVALFESVRLPNPDPEESEPILLDYQTIEELVDAILDWRDPDDLVRNFGAEDDDYESADYPYGAKDGPFESVAELQQVMGMNYELLRQVEPAVTVHSGRTEVNLQFAPKPVLMAQPGLNEQLVDRYIAERQQPGGAGGGLAGLPGGGALARGGGVTYSIESRASLPNGASSRLEAVVRLRATPAGRPFTVIGWKENDFSSDGSRTAQAEPQPES